MKYACRTQYRHGKGSTKEEKTRKEFEQSKAFFIIHNIQDSFLCMNVVESLLKGPAAGGASSPPHGLYGGREGGTLARSVCRGGWAKREGGGRCASFPLPPSLHIRCWVGRGCSP